MDVQQAGGTPAPDGEMPQDGQEVTFDSWLTSQDETVKGLIDSHVSGLKSALDSERNQRKELQKSLKETAKAVAEDSEAKSRLDAIAEQMSLYERQTAFYETAVAAGVTNLKLAWLAAREADAISKDGIVNLQQLQTAYPELFKKQSPAPGNAGAGTQTPPNGAGQSMDDVIRRKIGAM